MPYIKKSKRPPLLDWLATAPSMDDGELNFVITRLILREWRLWASYSNFARLTGILENVKQEFYRRVAAPYEDQKMKENGDVY